MECPVIRERLLSVVAVVVVAAAASTSAQA